MTIPLGLIGYSMGGGMAFALSIKSPELFKVMILNAPFVAFPFLSGKLPYHRDATAIAKFYPTLEISPNTKCPLQGFMKKFYDD